MTEVSLHAGHSAHQGCGGSPPLDPCHLWGSDPTPGRDRWPSTDATASAQRRAMTDIMEAGHTRNPGRRAELLRQALASLGHDGSSHSAACHGPGIRVTSAHTPPGDPCASDGGLTRSGDSVNTGEYTITAGENDDGSLTITNNATRQSVELWGDPHIEVNGQDIAQFQKGDVNIQLQDGTVIHVQPTATSGSGTSHIAQVSITRGNEAVTMTGTGASGFAGGVDTSGVMRDGCYQSALYNTPTATDITLGADGNLYYDNANGSVGALITANSHGGETDLDGAGGGLVGHPAATASSHNVHDLESRLMSVLARQPESFYRTAMMQELSHMMSQ